MKRFLLTALAAFLVDRLTKSWIAAHLPAGSFYTFHGVGDWVHLEHTRNKGLVFGWLSNSSAEVNVIIFVAGVVVVVFAAGEIRRRAHTLSLIGTGLVFGGALGNLTDRLLNNYVLDFIAVRLGFVFNFADAFILLGLLLLLLANLFALRAAAPAGPAMAQPAPAETLASEDGAPLDPDESSGGPA